MERFDSPIELVISDDPCVVIEMIEEINHQPALISQAHVRAFIDVANIDED